MHVQGEAESALGELQSVRREQGKSQAEASAAMQDAREALARESDIQGQLQKANQVLRCCCSHSCLCAQERYTIDQLRKADQVRGQLTQHSCRPYSSQRVRRHTVLLAASAL